MTVTQDKPAERRAARRPPRRRGHRLTGRDRAVVTAMVAVPALFVVLLVWFPAIASVLLSFASWSGFGGIEDIEWIGLENYENLTTNYPPFWPAIRHNLLWLAFLFLVPTPLGLLLAVLLDKEIRGTRFYQTALYLPVVLSLALVGFIWQLVYSRDQGLLNAVLGLEGEARIDWYGDPEINLWAVLVATAWRHTGYVMLLYLAGLKGVDRSLREAASVDGANQAQTFFRVVFPVMRPINVIVLVIVVIESLRAFDLVWVVNRGTNGLEIMAALLTQNVVGEASRIGFGSAMAVIMLLISSVFITVYLRVMFKEEKR
ncbi:carbohydrate ABC transporter permease [Actinorugispora endophytica]|uniref:Carbohydrate ABC transporter membrane protein 1 (CUT1 family) n=1 Tax=Actinorugispora endophytica TaxID=1605990 RepID=A0A4R6V2D4_9ACTN|nr:carbohydrate ABC transporter membrane protein 1 (CUT1 family) [Actinorugispora endophytica]